MPRVMAADPLRELTPVDVAIGRLDRILRAVTRREKPTAARPYPAEGVPEPVLPDRERRHAAGLMRVNHTGEVCAQALYVGQALGARDPATAATLNRAAQEEGDHLQWCATRLAELDGRPSYLDPAWFAGALGLGILAGLAGDRASMAFVEETERQVVRHLDSHLAELPVADRRSRAVVSAMRDDEARHAATAARSAAPMPGWLSCLMAVEARIMTTLAYRL